MLYDELSIDHRIHLHRRVAEALEQIAPELDRYYAEVAHHFALAAPALGCQAVASGARPSARWPSWHTRTRRASTRWPTAHERQPGADALVRCELLLGLADAQASTNDMISAKDTFVSGRLARSAGAEQLARRRARLRRQLVTLPADDARIVPLLEEALVAVGENGGALRARLLARLGGAGRRPSLSLDAVNLARRLDDPRRSRGQCGAAWSSSGGRTTSTG